MILVAIDPGSAESAFVAYNTATHGLRAFGTVPNDRLLEQLADLSADVELVAIELIEPRYGLQAGWEVLDTARWVGRFQQAVAPLRVELLRRSEILRHLGVVTAGKAARVSADAGVRAALIDRFGGPGAIGRKATPGPLYGISGDVWSAVAVAVVQADRDATS